jgi:hypothetical protein
MLVTNFRGAAKGCRALLPLKKRETQRRRPPMVSVVIDGERRRLPSPCRFTRTARGNGNERPGR